MPRVTDAEHYRRHQLLYAIWHQPGLRSLLSLLSVSAQWNLHEYYFLSRRFNQSGFTTRRQAIDREQPELRHVVGKHFKIIERSFAAASRAHGISAQQMQTAITHANTACGSDDAESLTPMTTANAHAIRSSHGTATRMRIKSIARPLDSAKLARAIVTMARRKQLGETSPSSDTGHSQRARPGQRVWRPRRLGRS
jgi:hypothetical protein